MSGPEDSGWVEARANPLPERWVPQGEIYIMSGRPLKIKEHGSDEWQTVNASSLSILFEDDDLAEAFERYSTEQFARLRSTVSDSWTVNWSTKMTKLEQRALFRMFGVAVKPLIHNGKKPRR